VNLLDSIGFNVTTNDSLSKVQSGSLNPGVSQSNNDILNFSVQNNNNYNILNSNLQQQDYNAYSNVNNNIYNSQKGMPEATVTTAATKGFSFINKKTAPQTQTQTTKTANEIHQQSDNLTSINHINNNSDNSGNVTQLKYSDQKFSELFNMDLLNEQGDIKNYNHASESGKRDKYEDFFKF